MTSISRRSLRLTGMAALVLLGFAGAATADVVDEAAELDAAREIFAELSGFDRSGGSLEVLETAEHSLTCWTVASRIEVAEPCREAFWTAVDALRAETDVGAPPVAQGGNGLADLRKEAADAAAEQGERLRAQTVQQPSADRARRGAAG